MPHALTHKVRKGRRAVIIDGRRTPFVKAFGSLMKHDAIDLGVAATRALLDATELSPTEIDSIVWGGVVIPPHAPNVAREIALDLDLPSSVEGMSVSRGRNAGGVTLAYAQALGAAAGLQIAVGGEAGRKTVSNSRVGDVDATSMSFHAGLAPSLNFAPSFPIGLTLEYRFELDRDTYDGNELAEVEPGSETVAKGHRFGAGLYYTGRRDLMLGWIGGLALLEDREAAIGSVTETPDAPDAVLLSAQFDMRYFF